ncbi:MAG: protein phosphatase 2C domain-containing protein [Saprospiraceae bacterium]|jgi:hypothetical protein|nr:protein phosphatase 2C domain-containing protein [Saprospiraceae bacterium]
MENTSMQLAFASVQGPAHKKQVPAIPCQDAGIATTLSNGWIVLIASDGAGSSLHSDVASRFCVQHLQILLEENCQALHTLIDGQQFRPDAGTAWEKVSRDIFTKVRSALLDKSSAENIPAQHLHCTLLMTLLCPAGFLTAHVGDGRAGYTDQAAHALLTPFMTFVAGATYFLIKEGWEDIFRATCTPVSASEVQYFFVSTDGCQSYITDQQAKAPSSGPFDAILGEEAYYDGNLPYHPFFVGLIDSLREENDAEGRNLRLYRLLDQGVYALKGEENVLQSLIHPSLEDDKTLLLGYQ